MSTGPDHWMQFVTAGDANMRQSNEGSSYRAAPSLFDDTTDDTLPTLNTFLSFKH